MTDQPNGLRECPFCKSNFVGIEHDGSIFAGQTYPGYSASDGWKVRCDGCGNQTAWWHSETDARKAWNTRSTQPARDAAEGAVSPCPVCGINNNSPFPCEHKTAPPKPAPSAPGHTDLMVTPESVDAFMEKNPLPAPDAMREALRVISTMAVCEDGEVAENLQQIVEACRDVASEALAAPVLPADRVQNLSGTDLLPMDKVRKIDRALSSSGTGAAEPVAWPSAVDLAKIIDPMAFTGPDASKVGRQATAIKKANYIRRLYAAPPVRGDRETLEAFARQLEQRANGYEARGTSIFNGHIIADELNEQAARLRALSLPVQPGAGEREALKPFADFGRGVDGADIRDGLMRDRICDWFGPSDFDAARAAYGRQAPHSSSEGGR